MTLNLLKKYSALLDMPYDSLEKNISSIRAVFDRDFKTGTLYFRNKLIHPIPSDDDFCMDLLFQHLTHKIKNKDTNSRNDFDRNRAVRLHWIKPHCEKNISDSLTVFSTREKHRVYRTYIYNEKEKYVIVLEPLRCGDSYYLCSAYKLEGKDYRRDSIKSKYKYKLDEIL